ncbi:hypothetical protein A7312_27765 [Paenibacillus polymyxa]|uniref:Uncharacterized protein n=1 Tax=Paenibacillus polymyxa TaxID=1406 RepID=A0ABX2ZE08_PAEPO|nr:hypothetical protein A7312_27765 [Paenibacillus polymyxa]
MKDVLMNYLSTALCMAITMLILYYPIKWLAKNNKTTISFKQYYYMSLIYFVVASIFHKFP